MNQGALTNIRVIDLSRVLAGPYCTMMLADYGAEVIKVERPGSGDGTRQWGPPWVGDESAYFLSVNRNKKSITLNLKTDEGKTIVKRLAADADVVIENFKPGTMARMGLDYETLSADNPGLIFCAISGYGQNGRYRDRPGYDFMIQAQGGIMSITGPADGEPHKVGVAIVDITTGLIAANAILAALHHRTQTGQGQFIDVALLDAQVAWLANVAHNYFATGEPPMRHGNAHPNIVPYETFETANGRIAIAIGTDDQYRRFCTLANRLDLWDDVRFQANNGRVTHRAELVPLLQAVFRSKSSAAWLDLLLAENIPAGPINDVPTILNDPHVRERGMVQTAVHETIGDMQLLGPVAKLSLTPAKINSAPPPLGHHTNDILQNKLGMSAAEIEILKVNGVI